MPWHVAKSSDCPASKPWACIKDSDGTVQGCHATKESAQKQMAALYANEPRASMSSNSDYPVENRSVGQVADVNIRQRHVDVIVAPWDEEAEVFWRGEVWRERFLRGAFNGIENHAGRVAVNREHTKGATVGRVLKFDPYHADGLFARIKIAKTPAGEEVLELADDEDGPMIGISGGFVMRGSDVDLEKRSRLRTVKRSFVDHVSFVEDEAYKKARVLAVREGPQAQASGIGRIVTPNLDEFMNDELIRWANSRRG